ncbi:murein biosynthesis integral membrane protein MurJ [Zhaonella formicivorans]|uniref:murein biosynthesis integral membrane protein MurJ n=1 Tax=Zhaonella formicivorans TaxID=2528593 RepID=UPI001D12C00D|nr:murein biosynthesis integral membrane protein MurJ [Zhaonella formicivorans]
MSKVARAAFIVLMMNLISRLLGFVRDAVIAREFGATGATDAYLVAYTLPYSLQAILGMAFATVMVPAVTGYLLREEEDEGWRVVSSMINGTTLALGVITLLGIIFAPQLVKILAPGFDGETVQLTAYLSRIMFPSIIFMGLGMLITGVLNAGKQFTMPAFAPAFANIIVILAVVLFGAKYRIQGLAVGTLAGFIGFLFIQLPNLKKIRFRFHFILDLRHPAVRKLAMRVLPMSLSIAVNQILLALNRFFASSLTPGSITALDFANRLMNLPLGVFVAAVSTAVFPAMAEGVAKKDNEGLARTISRGLGAVTVTILPAALSLIVLKEPVVRLLFERGAFDAEATAQTAVALLYFSVGLWFLAVNTVLTRAFYALEDLKTPLLYGAVSVLVNIAFSIVLLPLLGHGGLALANSLAAGVNMIQLYWALQHRIKELQLVPSLLTTVKCLLAALIMAASMMVLLAGFGSFFGTGKIGLLLEVCLAGGLGTVLYAVLVILLKVEEAGWFLGRLRRKSAAASLK